MKPIAKTIQMIAWFDEEGKINPIKFKYSGEDDEIKVILINKILSRNWEKLSWNLMWKFTCSSIVDGIECIYNITYDLINGIWLLFMCSSINKYNS